VLVPAPTAQDRHQPKESDEKFNWLSDDSVVLQPQLAIAVYRNGAGGLVIRQERDWNDEDDTFIVISPENIDSFVDKLTDLAGFPAFGGPQPTPTKRGTR
jgi:hypothetical protein